MDIEISGFGAARKLQELLESVTEVETCRCKRCELITLTAKKSNAKTDAEIGAIVREVDKFLASKRE